MKYDFCFLYHPHPYEVDPEAQLGLGLLLLATYAEQFGASVKVLNCQGYTLPNSLACIPSCENLMMYGCAVDFPVLKETARLGKLRGLCDRVCVGGPITKGPGIPYVDIIVDGFGEDFVCDLYTGVNYNTKPNSLRKDINLYPFPKRSLLGRSYGGNIFKDPSLSCTVSSTILTSRGCKYRCAFCTSGSEDFYQDYEISRIERELEDCLSLGIENIRISDDNLVRNSNRLEELCNLFKRAKIKWRASVRVHPSSLEMYSMMKESGCEELSFGVESGDQQVLNTLNKGVTVKQSIQAIQRANKAGILTRALLMMGTPGERKSTLRKNKDWVRKAGPTMVSLKMFVPYPGTAIYSNPSKYGCLLKPVDMNNSAYRPDGSEPKANIVNLNTGMTSENLTKNFQKMKHFLEREGKENRG